VIFTLGAELAALLSAREHRPAADDRRGDLRRLPAEHRPRDLGGHWYALAGLAGAGAAALALRTTRPATLHVFLWSIDALSVAMVALAGVATAALANTIAGFVARRRLRAEVRALEEHIRTLQIPPGSPVRQDGREVGPPE